MAVTVGYEGWVSMLRAAVARVRVSNEVLSKLDSFGGDGDHGTTMLRAMENVEKAIAANTSKKADDLLKEVGWAIMGVDGGATGPLLGTLFMSMGEAAGRSAMDTAALAAAFEAGLAGVRKQTKAKPGDKTMMDALVPAVEALRSAAKSGMDVPQALRLAAAAAEQGAAATAQMQARFGRAKNLGAKSIGNADAGATSISLIFRGFAESEGTNG